MIEEKMHFRTIAGISVFAIFASIPLRADKAPFTRDQIQELHHLLDTGNGILKATGKDLGNEFSALPDNSGYLMAYLPPGGGPIFRLDTNFRLISATSVNSTGASPTLIPHSTAITQYNQTIIVWRKILDHADR
jgi:hypothetical protein